MGQDWKFEAKSFPIVESIWVPPGQIWLVGEPTMTKKDKPAESPSDAQYWNWALVALRREKRALEVEMFLADQDPKSVSAQWWESVGRPRWIQVREAISELERVLSRAQKPQRERKKRRKEWPTVSVRGRLV